MKINSLIMHQEYIMNGSVLVQVGRNQKENDLLISNTKPENLWMHLSELSSGHLVIHTGGVKIPKKELVYCCQLLNKFKKTSG